MRRLTTLAVIALSACLLAPTAHAQSGDPAATIERALKAQGGAESLARAKASFHRTQGMFHTGDLKNIKFTGESFSEANNRGNVTLHGEDNEQIVIAMIINGDKVWDFVNGTLIPLTKDRQKQMRIAAYADKVSSLTSLLKDGGYTLTSLGETKVKAMAVGGIKVRSAGMPDIDLYFDKSTGLLVKCAYRTNDETGKEFFREAYYSRFEPFDPAAEPLKVLHKAKQDVDGPAVLKFLEDRIPKKEEREQIDFLISELGRNAFSAREKASSALQKFGPKAAGPLRAVLASTDREVTRRAEQLLDKLGQNGESALATAVVRLLAVRKPPGAAEGLLAYLPSACDDTVLKEVKYALVSLVESDRKARLAVEAALKGTDPLRKTAAKEVLSEDGGEFLQQPGRRVVVESLTLPRIYQSYRDGQLSMHIEAFDYQFFNRLDDALFNKPGK